MMISRRNFVASLSLLPAALAAAAEVRLPTNRNVKWALSSALWNYFPALPFTDILDVMSVCTIAMSALLAGLSLPGLYGQQPQQRCATISEIQGGVNSIVAKAHGDDTLSACLVDFKVIDDRTYTGVYLVRNGKPRRLKTYIDAGASGPLIWSPDSSSFAVNWTRGGANGPWFVDIFNAKTGIWRTLHTEAGGEFVKAAGCDPLRQNDLVNIQMKEWPSVDMAVIEVSVDTVASSCKSDKIMTPARFKIRIPSGEIISREP